MNRYCFHIQWLGFCAALILAGGCGQTPGNTATKGEIAALFDQWNAALATGNPAEVVKLYAPDAILLPTISNKVRTNHAEIEDYFEHFLKYKPIGRIDHQIIRIFGDVAIDSGSYTFTLTENGTPKGVRGRYTFVYAKQGNRWMIVEQHSSMMPENEKSE